MLTFDFSKNRGTFCPPNFRLVILKEKSVCYSNTSCCSSLRDVQVGRPFGTTFCGSSNLEQILPFWATFEQNIGLEHISSTKKSTILLIENFIFKIFWKMFFSWPMLVIILKNENKALYQRFYKNIKKLRCQLFKFREQLFGFLANF